MSKTVHVNLGDRSYDIAVGRGMSAGQSIAGQGASAVLLVTDSNVGPLHGDRVEAQLAGQGLQVHRAAIPAGESSKSLAVFGNVLQQAVEAGLDRRSAVVALGGGVVGDLAGFVAATLYRGVPLIQVPTTLLAMVDSSVGGKTAINLPQGKNLVGSFYQPREVAADLDTLATLPEREYLSGLAEVVKYGVIWDEAFFRELESLAGKLRERDPDALEEVVARCCEIKAEVVAMDEHESGVRAVLNFGHTLAHALEQVAGYGTWLHGEAVAVGMSYAARVSVREKGLDAAAARRLDALLCACGLPAALDARGAAPPWQTVRDGMRTDKKQRGGVPRFVLAEGLGQVVFDCRIDEPILQAVYADMLQECAGD